MGQRRMFSKRITESARFLKMPPTSQLLYFHLNLSADDDGIVEAFKIMRMVGSNEDDLKVLCAKEFVKILNEELVAYILDWTEHNVIRADRKIDSVYKGLLLQIIPDANLIEAKPRKVIGNINGNWDEMIKPFLGKYSPLMIEAFTDYWRQKNENGKKELWQMQKVFDINRRLKTWKRNDDNFRYEKEARFAAKRQNEEPQGEARGSSEFTGIGELAKKYGN